MNDQTERQTNADYPARCYDDSVNEVPEITRALSRSPKETNQDHKPIEDEAAPAATATKTRDTNSAGKLWVHLLKDSVDRC